MPNEGILPDQFHPRQLRENCDHRHDGVLFEGRRAAVSTDRRSAAKTTHTVPLNAKGVTRIVTDGTSPDIKVGWARVISLPPHSCFPMGRSAIFQTVVDGRIGSQAGVPASTPEPRLTTYADTRGFAESGVALANPNSSSVILTLNLRNTSGQTVSSTIGTLQALGHTAQLPTELFPAGFDEFEGVLEILTTGLSISGVALRYDNPGGSVFVTTPVLVIR